MKIIFEPDNVIREKIKQRIMTTGKKTAYFRVTVEGKRSFTHPGSPLGKVCVIRCVFHFSPFGKIRQKKSWYEKSYQLKQLVKLCFIHQPLLRQKSPDNQRAQ